MNSVIRQTTLIKFSIFLAKLSCHRAHVSPVLVLGDSPRVKKIMQAHIHTQRYKRSPYGDCGEPVLNQNPEIRICEAKKVLMNWL